MFSPEFFLKEKNARYVMINDHAVYTKILIFIRDENDLITSNDLDLVHNQQGKLYHHIRQLKLRI